MNRIPSLSPVAATPWKGGVNVTAALQFAPGVNVTLNPLPQAFVVAATTVKLPLLELMLIFMFTVPLLVTVTVFCGLELGGVACVTLPKVRLVTERERAGPPGLEVPLSLVVCVLLATLSESSVTVRVPPSAPSPCGVKATVMLQLARGARVAPTGQLFACW